MEVLSPEQIAALRLQRYNATAVWIHKAQEDLMRIRVRPDYPMPVHKPGQYTSLGLGYWEPRYPGCQAETLKPGDQAKLVRRAYSIGCPVLDDQGQIFDRDRHDWLEFYVVLVRESTKEQAPGLTPRLFLLKAGDRLNMGEKFTGHFTLDGVQRGDTVLFLSTGTGEAPHNYMLCELLKRGHEGRLLAACCIRYRRDLAYWEVHEELARRYSNYSYVALTTREADVKNKVYIQDLLTSGRLEEELGQRLDPERTHVYLCGNPQMIGVPVKDAATGQRVYPKPTGVIELLEQRGFQMDNAQAKIRGNIHFEEYW